MVVTPVGEVLDFLTRTPTSAGGVLRQSRDETAGRMQRIQFPATLHGSR